MIKHRKYSRREQLEMIELRLLETRMKFINSFNPIIKKLFMKQLLNTYDKGGQDMLDDWKWISKRFKKLNIVVGSRR